MVARSLSGCVRAAGRFFGVQEAVSGEAPFAYSKQAATRQYEKTSRP
ncbi:MAG: hypothetical protein R8K48_08840 [Gallionella sp.]